MRLRRLGRFWPAIPVIATLLIVYAAMPGRSTFTISPETTYVTGPATEDGFVDYSTALNARLSQGVPPEKNANALIVQALGPHPEGATMPPEYWQWLGVECPPEEGSYFIDRRKYYEANMKDREEDVHAQSGRLFLDDDDGRTPQQHWDERVDRAGHWPWKAKDEPDVAGWLKQNDKPLALVIEASKRTTYYNPLVSRSNDVRSARLIGSLLPTVQKCREVALALCCRAMSRMADGDAEGAWQDLIAVQRLGRLLSSNGTLIETLVGIAIEVISGNAIVTLLSQGEYSSKQARAWLDELRTLQPIAPLADKLDRCERFMTLDVLQSISANGTRELDQLAGLVGGQRPQHNPFGDRLFTRSVDFDPAFRRVNEVYDRYIAAARLPDRASRKLEFAKLLAEIKEAEADGQGLTARTFAGKARRGELIGNRVVALLSPSLEKLLDAIDRAEQTHTNLELALALATYRADMKRYPPRLDDLVPKYLPKIPPDLFSGRPLIYRPTADGYLLYSVGMNGIDEDGRWQDDQPRGDDLRVRIPVKEPGTKKPPRGGISGRHKAVGASRASFADSIPVDQECPDMTLTSRIH